jgi:thioredoxin reductase (NADPH)
MKNQADVAIIGAGPLGIELAVALKSAGISYLHFDKGQIGQMIYNFPPQTRFFSSSDRIGIAGMPIQTVDQQKCSREEYLAYLRTVVLHFQLKINAYEEVIHVEKNSSGFSMTTKTSAGEQRYLVRYLVLATGGTAYSRRLGISGEDLPHVSIKMEDPHRYFQRQVLVIGGRNSAVETALRCHHAGAYVTLAAKQQLDSQHIKYWLWPEIEGCIERGEIKCFTDVEILEIQPKQVLLKSNKDERKITFASDFVIKAVGFEADMSLFKQLRVSLSKEQHYPHFNNETMETDVENVFVLGTAVAGTQKKYRVFIENCHQHVQKILQTIGKRLGKSLVENLPISKSTNNRVETHLEE